MKIGAGFSTGRLSYTHSHDEDYRRTLSNVNPDRIKDNIVFIDHLKGKDIENFINDGMQKYIDEYNIGKKPCRQIKTNYTEWHKSQKRYQQGGKIEFAWEAVLSYGSMDTIGKLYEDPNTRQKIYDESKSLFEHWLDEWQKQYPHLKIISAIAHYDEKTPHMHVMYTSIADNYERGIKHQICMSRALQQDGIEKITDTKQALEAGGFQQSRFYKQFRHNIMNPSLIKLGYELKEEISGLEHIDSRIYPEVAKQLDVAKDFIEELKQAEEIERTPVYDPKTVKTIQHKESILSKTEELVAMPVETFEALKSSADAKKLSNETKAKIKAQQKALEHFKETVTQSEREKQLTKENEELKKQVAKLESRYNKLKNRVIDFLRSHSLLNKFMELFRKQDEQEQLQKLEEKQQPKFTTNLEQSQENERER